MRNIIDDEFDGKSIVRIDPIGQLQFPGIIFLWRMGGKVIEKGFKSLFLGNKTLVVDISILIDIFMKQIIIYLYRLTSQSGIIRTF